MRTTHEPIEREAQMKPIEEILAAQQVDGDERFARWIHETWPNPEPTSRTRIFAIPLVEIRKISHKFKITSSANAARELIHRSQLLTEVAAGRESMYIPTKWLR